MRLLASIVLLSGSVAVASSAAAAPASPVAVARSCRTAIAHALGRLARLGLRELERCELRKARGRTDRDCTVLRAGVDKSTTYRRWAHRVTKIISARCPQDTTARDSYPGDPNAPGAIVGEPVLAIASIGATVEAGARDAGSASIATARGAAASASPDCFAAIAAARTLVATATMKTALRCQAVRDHGGLATGPLAPDCQVPPADDVIRTAAGRIAGACGHVGGLAIGACDALPSCALDAAVETGIELARIAAGECGNGVLDRGEECDDGNDDPTDECHQCVAAVCGNGRVEADEECDDGNPTDFDGCTDCRVAVCGDGVTEGHEECDDANDVPLDGCTDCRSDPVACSSAGILATVTFDFDAVRFPIAGVRIRLAYDNAALSIPGSAVALSVIQRVKNVTGVSAGVTFAVADRDDLPSEGARDGVDDTLQTLFAAGSGQLPAGPFEQVRFDCSGAEARASQIKCTADQVTDPNLIAIGDEATREATRCSITLEAAPVR